VTSQTAEPDEQAGFADARYLNLETYRRNGVAVRTPVWFAAAPKDASGAGSRRFYVISIADAGKVKRIRRNGAARIAACNMWGKVTGPWSDAVVEIVTGDEFDLGRRLLDRKYFPWRQIGNLTAKLSRRERVVLAIRPAKANG